MKVSQMIKPLFAALVKVFGTNLKDCRTGEWIARAIILSWGGRVYLLGLHGKDQVIPIFLPQGNMSFWKRTIGFTVHPRPDFPRERPPHA